MSMPVVAGGGQIIFIEKYSMGFRTLTVNAIDARAHWPSLAGARGLGAAIFLLLLALVPRLGAATNGARAAMPESIREVPAATVTTGFQPNLVGAAGPSVTRTNLLRAELDATMPFNVSLKMRNFAELEARVARGEVIDPAEMAARYWPLPEDYAAAVDWLRQQGFAISLDSGGSVIFASGTVAQVRDAFQVSMARVTSAGEEFTSAISAPSVPVELAPALVGINGLQPHLRKHPHLKHPDSATTPFVTPYIPSDILHAYGADTLTQNGGGQTIGIVMSGFPKTSDLTQFWSVCNISQTINSVSFIKVGTGPNAGPGSADVEEATLDVEWSSSIAPAAKIRLYGTADLGDANLDLAYQQIYNDATSNLLQLNLHVVSLSYGGLEEGTSTSQLQTDDQLFAQLAGAGITVFVSSGDDGSTPSGVLDPESPATDPNVTGVGGTSISFNTTTGAVTNEKVWNNASNSASGGGMSKVFSRPVWQTGSGALGSQSNRMVPDVAAPGDPNTGAMILLNGSQLKIGGTSWGAPTWAGFAALINQARAANGGTSLGLLGPKIYPLVGTSSFFDIVLGNNDPRGNGAPAGSANYSATVGYDMCTGIGRPVFPDLFNVLTTVLLPPQNVTLAPGQTAFFSPITTGAVSFQWQRMAANTSTWVTLTDDATYSGSATAVLAVHAVTQAMSGDQFECVINVGNGNVTTSAATLTVVAPQYYIGTFAGQAGAAGTANGAGAAAQFNAPNETSLDAGGNIFVADFLNNSVRKITPDGNVTTYAGSSSGTAGLANGISSAALFNGTNAVTVVLGGVNNGTIYVADSSNNVIRKITPAGNVTTFAGSTSGASGSRNGTGTGALFTFPEGVAVDSGGNIYVADTENNLIRKITSAGVVTTLAGKAGVTGFADGTGTNATFNFPSAVALDSANNVYVADSNNNAIRKITPGGAVTTLAGTAPLQGVADGTGAFARFNFPSGLTVDAGGNIFVADTNNNAIRKITPAGVVTTLAGRPGVAGSADGVGCAAGFNQPYGLAVDGSGVLYIADTYNDTVRKAVFAVAPSIQTQPANTTILVGASGGFAVVASGVPAPSYQWQRLPSGGNTWANLTDNTTFNGSTTANLTINSTTVGMNGDQFQVIVANGVGSVTSNVAVLTTAEPPFFTTQPGNATATAGDNVNFTVAASGLPNVITYQWQILAPGGLSWANLTDDGVTYTGSNTTTLAVANVALVMNGTQFQCVADNGVNPNAISNSATLSVDSPPSFNTQPDDQTVTAGNSVSFNVVVGGVPAPTLQWQRLPSGSSTWLNLADNATFNGSLTNKLTINGTTVAMNGDQFRAIINNGLGNLTSNIATLTMQASPAFTAQPVDTTVNVGDGAAFGVTATGLPAPTYQWQRLPSGSSTWANLTDDATYAGSATANLTVNSTTSAMTGDQFRVVIANQLGNVTSNAATLAVQFSPTFTLQPANTTVNAGNPASFAVIVAGVPGPSYQWQILPSGGSAWANLTDDATYNGSATANLTVNATTVLMDGDQFRVLIGNNLGNITSNGAMLNVQILPAFTAQPANTTVNVGDGASFGVTATGLPAPTYQWQRLPSGGNTWANLTDDATYNGSATANLTVNATTASMNGDQFRAVIDNGLGNVTSNGVTLTVQTPPAFIAQPANAVVRVGTGASFGVAATGLPTPTFQWQRLPSGGSAWANLTNNATYNGSATANLTVNATTSAMNGDQFRAVIGNGLGTVTSNAVSLTVQTPPAFTAQPANTTVTAGTAASFGVTSTGLPAPSYQWQRLPARSRIWANLADNATYGGTATANLTVNATTSAMNGDQFRVILSNGLGNVTSSAVTLTVQAPPAITAQPANATVNAGGKAAFGITATGLPAPVFAWQRLPSGGSIWANLTDNLTYNGSATANLSVNITTSSMNGDQFRALVSNLLGNVTSNAAILTVQTAPAITTQPTDQLFDAGDTLTFSAAASGVPTPTLQWQRRPSGGSVWANLTDNATYHGTATATLTINSATAGMNGDQFECVATNILGNATSNSAALLLKTSPSFNTQSASVTATAGGSTQFVVAATGVPNTISYQWQMLAPGGSVWASLTDDGVSFTGSNTSTLTVSNLTVGQSGSQFQCVADNGVNPAAISNAASLVVVPAGYLSWAAALNLAGANALPDARPFDDALPNLVRYAMNLGAAPAPGDLPGLSTQVVNGVSYLTLQYNQLKSLSGVKLVAQYSYDLAAWQPLVNGAVVQLADPNQQTDQFSASIAIPPSGQVFLRLVVEPSP